jgi:hypothetical protein
MSDERDRVARLFEGDALAVAPGYKHLLDEAPIMPHDFWGRVTFVYQGGKLVNLSVEETIKPDVRGR